MKIIKSNTSREAYLSLSKELKSTINGRNIVIAPDRFAVSVTRAIMQTLNLTTMTSVEVIPFSKLGERFIPKEIKKCLSPNGAVMLLSKVLIRLSENKELSHYYNVARKDGFPSELYAAITSLRNSGVSPDDIIDSIDKMPNAFKVKAKDLNKIYSEYLNELIKDNEDSTTILEKLESYFIDNNSEIKGINFYVTDIYEFTKKELDILHILANNALSLTISIPYGYDYPNNFIYPNYLLSKLSKLLDDGKPEIIDSIDKLSTTKDVISKYLFSYKFPKEKFLAENLFLRHAKDKYDEILSLALDIVKGVREGKRYNEYEVYISNLDEYSGELKSIFSRYNIPFFIDKKASLSEQAKSRYLLSAIKCVKSGLSRQDILDFVKNPLFYEENKEITINDVFEFENYILAYNVDHAQFKTDFELFDESNKIIKTKQLDVVNPNDSKIKKSTEDFFVFNNYVPNIVRRVLINKLKPLLELNINSCEMLSFVSAIRQILEESENGWRKHVNDLEGLSQYYLKCSEQVDGKIKTILDEVEEVLNIKSDIVQFYTLIKSMIDNEEIALVPTYLDCVFIGGLESRFMGEHNIYILGATNAEIPCIPSGGAILTRKEKEELLDRAMIEILPSDRQQLAANMYKVCDIMKKPMDMLVISYPENTSSSQTKPSTIITDLLKYFSNLKLEGIDFSSIMNDPNYIEEAKLIFSTREACYYEVLKNKISNVATGDEEVLYNCALEMVGDKKEELKKLFSIPEKIDSNNIKIFTDYTSVSRIETFYKCPYQYYLKYILHAKNRLEDKFEGKENGNIIHNILEEFMNDVKAGKTFTKEEIKNSVYTYFEHSLKKNNYERLMLKLESKRVLLRVREEGVRLCQNMLTILNRSKFKPMYLEGKIGDKDAVISPLTIDCGETKVKLTGSIDRVDKYNDDFYIIDYKTYKSADLKLAELYEGLKIQPLLYMRAIESDKKLTPVGVFYLPIHSSFIDVDDNALRLKGLASNDRDTLIAIDSNVETDVNKSFVTVKMKNKNQELDPNSHIDKKQFDVLGDYAMKVSAQAIKNIIDGYIKPSPIVSISCEHCDFENICVFKNKNTRKLKSLGMDVFVKKEEVEDDID